MSEVAEHSERFEPVRAAAGQDTTAQEEGAFEQSLGEVALAESVAGFSAQRAELVRRSATEWASALVDLGGRNNLVCFRDQRWGTLDLSACPAGAIDGLLGERPVTSATLFPDPEQREEQLRRLRTIHKKARENFEERGVHTLTLACGLASWENQSGSAWTPCAPVLLRHARLRPLGAAQDEFELELVDDMELNATLVHILKRDFDCELPQDQLLERIDGVIDERWELDETYNWLREHAERVPNFSIDARMVLANFAYAKLPMVRDIESSFESLVAHELIAAIAGDKEARQAIRERGPDPNALPSPDATPLEDEFLVLDADSSQNYAISAALGGTNLIVRGPPGTGKSQTIANLIASLTARQKTVLFVAEKRAAIDAVLKRLTEQGLDELVLDVHGGAGSRRAFAERIGQALMASRSVPRTDGAASRQRVEANREHLNHYVEALHRERVPWGMSVYDMRAQLIGLGGIDSELRLTASELQDLDRETIAKAETDLRDFARLGGLTLEHGESPWRHAKIADIEQAQSAHGSVEELRHSLSAAVAPLRDAADQTRVPPASTLAGWQPILELWARVEETRQCFASSIYETDLEQLCAQMTPASAGGLTRMKASLGSGGYRAARKALRQHLSGNANLGDRDLLLAASEAAQQKLRWRQLSSTGDPSVPDQGDVQQMAATLQAQVEQVAAITHRSDLAELEVEELERWLTQLAADHTTLLKLPQLSRLEESLARAHLEPLLIDLKQRALDEDRAVGQLRSVWLASILDSLLFEEVPLSAFDADRHEATIEEYRAGDLDHIDNTPARIRRICAERFHRARDEFPEQDSLLIAQAQLKRRHLPVRKVIRQAEDLLLALKPCWAMSPLNVSQLLPAKQMFDVVIFDEASQIPPADAIPAMARGSQLVVAGDEKQLPPTAFFTSETPDELEDLEDDEEQTPSAGPLKAAGTVGTGGFESILAALNPILRWRMLQWHYRSRDERLIGFSNTHIYDRQLVTFPGAGGDRVLRHIEAPWQPGADTNSPSPEVKAAVDLMIEHAQRRPEESLGVITMGIRHSQRVDEQLRRRLRENGDLMREVGEFFDENRDQYCFVKNLEQVQGDERDAIILSIGYGKSANGTLPLRFGPLLKDGGERRLNVAVTRAKSRITLLSSFTADDIDISKSSANGVHLLRQYLQYVQSDGQNLGDRVLEKPALNPFEVDVRDTLASQGLQLVPQYGISGYWIDFVAPHPANPGRYVLAIECDGASYHSSQSARDRDRLRQSQLENLGWRFHRIWSSEWFYDKERSVQRVLAAYEQAVQRADHSPSADPQAPASPTSPSPPVEPTRPEGVDPSDGADVEHDGNAVFSPGRPQAGRPPIVAGLPIDEQPVERLIDLARWIESGDELYSLEEMVRKMMVELGYQRKGSRIDAKLRLAIQRARNSHPQC